MRREDPLKGAQPSRIIRTHATPIPHVMLDPSLFTAKGTLASVPTLFAGNQTDSIKFFVPSSFFSVMQGGSETAAMTVMRYFGWRKTSPDLSEVAESLSRFKSVCLPFTIDSHDQERFTQFAHDLAEVIGKTDIMARGHLHRTILEEWVFLQTQSMIGSRLRTVFDVFIESGAAGMQLSRKALDVVVSKAVKEDKPNPLTRGDYRKSLGKFVAVAGIEILALSEVPAFAKFVAGTAVGTFWIFDP